MTMVSKKAPHWSSPALINGERGNLSSEDLAGSWYVLYFWPFDFTGICHSEVLGFMALENRFAEAGIKLIGASCNTIHAHQAWFANTEAFPDGGPTHPILADNTRRVSKAFEVYSKKIGCAYRANVLVSPDGIVMSLGVNFLPVARDPQDVLTTALAFSGPGSCSVPGRTEL